MDLEENADLAAPTHCTIPREGNRLIMRESKPPAVSIATGATLLIALSFLAVVPFLVWASKRGFDITDEGFYLLGAQFPNEILMWPDSAHRYTAILFSLVGHDVVVLRWVGIALQLLFAAVLFYGLRHALLRIDHRLRQAFRGSALMWSFVTLGTMLYYHWMLATPSYNLFNALAVNGVGGLLIFSVASTDHACSKRQASLAAFGVGLCLGLSFFVKSPTGVALFALSVGAVLAWPGIGCAGKTFRIRAMMLGFVCWSACHFLFLESPGEWWSSFSGGLTLVTALGAGHEVGQLASFRQQCWAFFKDSLNMFWRTYATVAASAIGLFALPALRRQKPALFVVWASLAPVIFVWDASRFGWDYVAWREQPSGIFLFYAGSFILAVLLSALALLLRPAHAVDSPGSRFVRMGILGLFMGALPFAAALGTSNPIGVNVILNMGPWFCLLWSLFAFVGLRLRSWSATVAGVAVVGGFALVQVFSGVLIHPYRLNGGILRQVVPTRIGSPATQLRLDPETHKFFNEIRRLADDCGLKPGDDVVALYSMPGVVFALGARSPVIPWYTGGYPGGQAYNELALDKVPLRRLRRAYILENGPDGAPLHELARYGLQFPGGYELCGGAAWPLSGTSVRLWKPLIRAGGSRATPPHDSGWAASDNAGRSSCPPRVDKIQKGGVNGNSVAP